MILTTGGISATRPPTKAVFDSDDSLLYYEVRPDVFDTLNVWARQHDPLLEEIAALRGWVKADSHYFAIQDSIEANLNRQIALAQLRGNIYKELWEANRRSVLQRFWDDAKLPLGIAIGAFVAAEAVRLTK